MSYWARVALTIAAVSAILLALWSVINIVILVLMAAVLAIGLDPAVRFIERRGRSRGRAVTLIFLAALGIAILFALLVIPPLVTQVGELADDIPGYAARTRPNATTRSDGTSARTMSRSDSRSSSRSSRRRSRAPSARSSVSPGRWGASSSTWSRSRS